MNNKKEFKLKLMYWYNILVTGGFALLIAVINPLQLRLLFTLQ